MSSFDFVKAAHALSSVNFILFTKSFTASSFEGCSWGSKPMQGFWPVLMKKGECCMDKWIWLLYKLTKGKCHDLDFRVLDATSGSWGNERQVMPICVGTSQMDLASATWGW